MKATKGDSRTRALLELLRSRKRLLVLTHTNPDPDSMASAMGLRLLVDRKLGLATDIALSGRVMRAENRELVRALRAHQIPVELVGLTGLLSQPEVLDVLSVLEVLEDVTNNPALLRVLTGPRWRIGDRDLVLLGKRARYLAREPRTSDEPTGSHEETLARLLDEATERSEPTLLHSILEALESPGDAPYGDGALERFSDITAMFSRLRSHAHEPLPDVARMAIRELDLDVELEVAGIGTDNLALLIHAIADCLFRRTVTHRSVRHAKFGH